MKNILITGGMGYVGCPLTNYLVDKGHNVTVLDLMIYGENLLPKKKNLKVIKGDIRDQKLLKDILPGHDTLIHLACISNDPSFELNPNLGKSINLTSFEPIVEISIKSKIKKFIYASSSSVYGIKNIQNVNESCNLDPLTDYSLFKAKCEDILRNYSSKDFCTSILRPATVCGYSNRQRLDVIVNILTNLAFNKRKISIFGGEQLRPNIHIKDMIRAYDLIIETDDKKINNEIFNIGFENKSVLEIGKDVKNIVGEDVKLEFVKTDDNRSYHISSDKLKKKLNFNFKYSVLDAIKDLKFAFEKKLLPNSLNDSKYFNIKRMNEINLK
tara:strand:+ start:58 stop:1038 length:981 start_codon:yes stop_codon:yes gene_type:complete